RLRSSGLRVDVGMEAELARVSLAGHLIRTTRGRPQVLVKQALSSDLKIAAAGHRPVAITGPASNAQVQLMRVRADAILIGVGTALADNPSLTCRLPALEDRSPLRVVLDRRLDLSVESVLAQTARTVPVLVFAEETADERRRDALEAFGVIVRFASDVESALASLAGDGIQTLLVEAGARLARALHDADLIDRYEIFRSPKPIGADGIRAMQGLAVESALESSRYALHDTRRHGADIRRTYLRRSI
ncbi:MAG: RibD family protein, partial [Pseudomonadota bacterium]